MFVARGQVGQRQLRLRRPRAAARRRPARNPRRVPLRGREAHRQEAADLLLQVKDPQRAVTVEVFQTSKGRKIVKKAKRVARFRNRQRGFTWNGRKTSGKKARVARGVYFVRFRVTDDAKPKVDTRRVVVVERTNGRFYKKGKFILERHC